MNTAVVVYGENYTGSHFRGIADPHDGKSVKIVVTGTEQKIAEFILQNFNYGDDGETYTLEKLIQEYKKGEIVQFDGCGGVLAIGDMNGKNLFFARDFITKKEFSAVQWLDLGTVDANQFEWKKTRAGRLLAHTASDEVNRRVEKGVQ
jgi:hypothetical protein